MRSKVIDIGQDWNTHLGCRFIASSTRRRESGEEFLKEHLLPAVVRNDVVIVDFDNVLGFTPSFIDEAFGELVVLLGRERVDKVLRLRGTRSNFIVDLVRRRMEQAGADRDARHDTAVQRYGPTLQQLGEDV